MGRNDEAPKLVAREVIKDIKEGKLPSIGRAMRRVGYSESTIKTQSKRVKENPAYIKEVKPFVDVLDELMTDAIDVMKSKKNKASYRDATVGLKTLKDLKNIETGNPTDYTKISVDWNE